MGDPKMPQPGDDVVEVQITPENPHFGEKREASMIRDDINSRIDDIKTWIDTALQETKTVEELRTTLRSILARADEISNIIEELK